MTGKSAKGMCPRHYKATLNGRDPSVMTAIDERHYTITDGVVNIPLGIGAKDGWTKVDMEFEYLAGMKWHLTNKGRLGGRYVANSSNQVGRVVQTKLHSLVMPNNDPSLW